MKDAILQIVRALQNSGNTLKLRQLRDKTGLSDRYIRQVIEDSAIECRENGFSIQESPYKEYILKVWDNARFQQALVCSDDTQNRAKEILQYLLEHDGWVKTDDMAGHFFISRATMNRLMPKIKALAEEYELEIVARPKYGIRIEGSEINKRVCLAHCRTNHSESPNTVQTIQEILYDTLRAHDYDISDASFNNLVYHILILLRRLNAGIELPEPFALHGDYVRQIEIARELVQRIEYQFKVKIPQHEINYLVLHLLGKQTIQNNFEISQDTFDLADAIFAAIDQEKGTDFSGDLDFKVGFCLHLQPMLVRLRYHFQQVNPMLGQVKREMAEGYEMAMIAKIVIREKCSLELNDHEAGYLAVYFSLAQEKREKHKETLKFLVVCSTGRGTSQLLRYKLMAQYGLKDENITISSMVQLERIELKEYTCIISTVPIPFKVQIPVVLVNPILNQADTERVDQLLRELKARESQSEESVFRNDRIFSDRNFSSKEEILHFLARVCGGAQEDMLYEALCRREALSSTEVGNECCLPHPFGWECAEAQGVILLLNKPVRWQEGKVRFVFYLATPRDYPDRNKVTEALIRLVCDKQRLAHLEANPTAKGFWEASRA